MKTYIKSTTWGDLSSSEQTAVEYARQAYEGGGYDLDDAVHHGCNRVAWGNAEPEYEDEDFYEVEPNEENVFNYLFDEYTREGRNIHRSPYVNASTKIYSAQNSSSVWYRCVPKGANPASFNDWELGIHCGSKEQTEEICSTKYHGNCDIYRLELNPGATFSNPVSDSDAWSSAEAVAEILSDGFNIPTSIAEVIQAYRAGEWDKSSAGQYIIQTTGLLDPVVVYDNAVELSEQDIIILDPDSIQSIELVNAVEASSKLTGYRSKLFASVDTDPELTSKRIEYIYECLDNAPEVPTVDADDAPEAWSAYYHDAIDHKMWCFADAVEDGLFEENDWDEFKQLWDKCIARLAVPWS